MGNAALAYDYYEEIPDEQIELPAGGIANFLNATEGDWATEDDIPHAGIAKVQSVANELAKYGRYEDEYMVHAAHGETVVPMAVLEANPRLKKSLYSQMESMGLEPGRYVVGDELNSINPVTGQPEFFLKKLFKGLKKIVKKVFKVVVPIVATVLLAPVMGVVGASAFVSGASTLIQGGSLKDALKSAALGGLTAGVFKGIQGGIGSLKQGDKFFSGFSEGFKGALTPGGAVLGGADKVDPSSVPVEEGLPTYNAAAEAAEGTLDVVADAAPVDIPQIQAGVAEGVTDIASSGLQPTGQPIDFTAATEFSATPGGITQGQVAAPQVATPTAPAPIESLPVFQQSATPVTDAVSQANLPNLEVFADQPLPVDQVVQTAQGAAPAAGASAASAALPQAPTFMEAFKDIFTPGGMGPLESIKQMFFPSLPTDQVAEYMKTQGLNPESGADLAKFYDQLSKVPKEQLGLGAVRRYAPMAAGLTAFSALTTPEQEELEDPFAVTGQDLIDADPSRYIIPFGRPTTFDITRTGGNYVPTPPGAQDGGDISYFPRRNGAIAGPGTETSDDIPAMLSDGEFVMTAKAVRGAGNGSRKQGMQNMYSMMRNFEANA
jgi:hypothetical protein